jgi:hypothetical protein
LFREKATIQKILIDEDFRKSRDYEAVREDPNITSLITETDKIKYRQKVRISFKSSAKTNLILETSSVPGIFDQLSEWPRTTYA